MPLCEGQPPDLEELTHETIPIAMIIMHIKMIYRVFIILYLLIENAKNIIPVLITLLKDYKF